MDALSRDSVEMPFLMGFLKDLPLGFAKGQRRALEVLVLDHDVRFTHEKGWSGLGFPCST